MAEEFQIVGYDDCVLAHTDEVGSLWSSIKKGVKKVGKAVGKVGKAVARSPLVKMAATGAAFVFPPVGVPALAAIATANALVGATKDATKAAKALGVIKTTRTLAARGDVGAQRAVSLLANAARARARSVAPRPMARPAARPLARPVAKPPVRARPILKPPVKAAKKPTSSAPAGPVRQGFLVITGGADRGTIDFTGGRWRRA